MKEFDSIRIVDKGGDSLSFEMTGNVAGSPYDTIVFLLRATSGLIAASAKDSAKRFVHLTDLEGHRREVSAAKVVAETFLGPVPPGMAIFHKNGNPADNSVWNLVFRTPEEIGRMTGADSTRRPVLKFSATGELLECYSSARQAAKQNYFSYQAIIDRCNGKCKRHVLAPDGNYYAWDNTVGVRKAKEDLQALARQEGRLFAPKNWPAT